MTGVAATQRGRKALLSDLSPAATFIARNLNTPADADKYLRAVHELLDSSATLEHSLYDTHCRCCGERVPMLYMVWSYGVMCPHCERERVVSKSRFSIALGSCGISCIYFTAFGKIFSTNTRS